MRTGRNVLHPLGVFIPASPPTPAPHATLSLCLVFEAGLVLGSGLPGSSSGSPEPPPPKRGPSSRRGRVSRSEVSPLPPKCCAGGSRNKNQMWAWQRQRGGRSSSRRRWAFILSIVTSHPNLWHFNYSPARLLSLGQRVSSPCPLAWEGAATAWTPNPQAAPRKLGGARLAAPSCFYSPRGGGHPGIHGSMCESLSLHSRCSI